MGLKLRSSRRPPGWAKLDWKSRLHFFRSREDLSVCGRAWFNNEYCTEFYSPSLILHRARLCKNCLREMEAA